MQTYGTKPAGRAESRTYTVGLPVLITVHDDGRVEWEIDKSEAAQSIAEEYPHSWDGLHIAQPQVDADAAMVLRHVDAEAV